MAPTGVVGGDSATEENDGSVACAECATADNTYKKWQNDWCHYQQDTLAWLMCTAGMATIGTAGYLLLAIKFYQAWPLVVLGLGVVGFGFGMWWRVRKNVLSGHWFVMFTDRTTKNPHIHTYETSGTYHYDNNSLPMCLFVPTPGMRNSPNGWCARIGFRVFPESSFGRIEASPDFGDARLNLKQAGQAVRVRHLTADGGCLSELLVRTDYLLAEPETYLQDEGPINWLRDLKAAREKDDGVFDALDALAECMKNDKRSSPPAADARIVLEGLAAVSERQKFWLPEERRGEVRTVKQRVEEIYAQQVAHTRAQAAGRRVSRHRTSAAVTVSADFTDNT